MIFSWKLFFNCLNYSLVSLFCVYFDLFHTINDTGSHILLKNYFPLFFVLSIKICSILPRTFYRVLFTLFFNTRDAVLIPKFSRDAVWIPNLPINLHLLSQLTWFNFSPINLSLLWILHQNFCFFIFRYLPPSTIFMRCWIFPFFLQYFSSHPFMIFIPSILFLYYTSYWETSFPFHSKFPTSQIFSWSIWGRSLLSCNADFLYVKSYFGLFNFVSLLNLFCDSLS